MRTGGEGDRPGWDARGMVGVWGKREMRQDKNNSLNVEIDQFTSDFSKMSISISWG